MGLAQQGRLRQYYSLVSEAVRRYLERRFRILAMESPSSFTMHELRRKEITPEALGLVGALLEETDLVKFAKFTPEQDSAGSLLDRSRQLVRLTASPLSGPSGGGRGEK